MEYFEIEILDGVDLSGESYSHEVVPSARFMVTATNSEWTAPNGGSNYYYFENSTPNIWVNKAHCKRVNNCTLIGGE